MTFMRTIKFLATVFFIFGVMAVNDKVSANEADQTQNQKEKVYSTFILDSITPNKTRIVEYVPDKRVCSKLFHIEIDKHNVIRKVVYTGGCNGNGKGVGTLLEGMKVKDAIKKLEGIQCHKRGTSCPDQIAQALKQL